MAADLSAQMFRQPTQEEEQQLSELASRSIVRTEVSDTVSMVSSPGDPVPLLVSLQGRRSANSILSMAQSFLSPRATCARFCAMRPVMVPVTCSSGCTRRWARA